MGENKIIFYALVLLYGWFSGIWWPSVAQLWPPWSCWQSPEARQPASRGRKASSTRSRTGRWSALMLTDRSGHFVHNELWKTNVVNFLVVGLAILLLIHFIPALTQSILGPTMRATEVLPSVGQIMKHLPNPHIVPRKSLPGYNSVEFLFTRKLRRQRWRHSPVPVCHTCYEVCTVGTHPIAEFNICIFYYPTIQISWADNSVKCTFMLNMYLEKCFHLLL